MVLLKLHTLFKGFMPKMRVYAINPSTEFQGIHNMTYVLPTDPPQVDISSFKWDREISLEEATSRLEKTMYPFKEVTKSY